MATIPGKSLIATDIGFALEKPPADRITRTDRMKSSRFRLHAVFLIQNLLLAGFAPGLNANDIKIAPRISVDRVNQLLGRPETVIIDVRKPRNWWRTRKKILTAVREDPSKVDQWARKYTKDQTLIFY